MKKFIIILCLLFCSNVVFALDYSNYNVEDINSVRKATKDFQKEYKNKKESLEAEANFNDFLDFHNKFEIFPFQKMTKINTKNHQKMKKMNEKFS